MPEILLQGPVGVLQGKEEGGGGEAAAHCDPLPQLFGVLISTRSWGCLVMIMLQIGFHEAGSIMRTVYEGAHEEQHLQKEANQHSPTNARC